MSGIEGVRCLHLRFPGLPILMLTVHGDDDSIFGAVCAGACGYLLKETEPRRRLDTIREIHTGGASMSPEIARRVAPRWTSIFRRARSHPAASGGGSQLQELRPRTGTERRHRSPPRAPHLRPAARPSRSEAVWKAFGVSVFRTGHFPKWPGVLRPGRGTAGTPCMFMRLPVLHAGGLHWKNQNGD